MKKIFLVRHLPLFDYFFKTESRGGFILIFSTVVSLFIANSGVGHTWLNIWETKIAGESIRHWINDGFMAFFFLLIGLEVEREIYKGELSDLKNAMLPMFAALGGMFMPAVIYMTFNSGTDAINGFGIPMATDVAFSLGILSLFGKRIPVSLKVFLTSFAIIDDLGAILLIAFIYSNDIVLTNLLISLGIFALLFLFQVFRIKNLIPYLIGGIIGWYFMHESGVHATLAGILLAFAIPYSRNDETSPSYLMQQILHAPVAYVILPLFAISNTAISLNIFILNDFDIFLVMGIILGLLVGKPLGIMYMSWLGVKLKLARKPEDVSWHALLGISFLGGIGFTMSIFISYLAFDDSMKMSMAKLAVITGSLISAVVGILLLSILKSKKDILVQNSS
ncbi:MAG: Na+/H+ antiporter NhaA [Bacteroidales bacterium]|nr:Na+/H+ antiporter NhaA [Bacteroidales bacterium]